MIRSPVLLSACLLTLLGCRPDPEVPATSPAAPTAVSAAQAAVSAAGESVPSAATDAVTATLSGVIRGEVWYRQRIALPPSAVLTVQLLDVSRADAPATLLASQTLSAERQVPLAFELHYDPAQIDGRMSYALQARIEDGNQLRFINTERVAVLTRGAPQSDLKIRVDAVGN